MFSFLLDSVRPATTSFCSDRRDWAWRSLLDPQLGSPQLCMRYFGSAEINALCQGNFETKPSGWCLLLLSASFVEFPSIPLCHASLCGVQWTGILQTECSVVSCEVYDVLEGTEQNKKAHVLCCTQRFFRSGLTAIRGMTMSTSNATYASKSSIGRMVCELDSPRIRDRNSKRNTSALIWSNAVVLRATGD